MKFVKIQHYMINAEHVVWVVKRPDASKEDADAWTLEIALLNCDPIILAHYQQAEVHEMFKVFEKLLSLD